MFEIPLYLRDLVPLYKSGTTCGIFPFEVPFLMINIGMSTRSFEK